MEYKKITEVEMIEEPSENAAVLAEDNGKLRRVPFKNIGGNGGGLPAGGEPHQMLVTDAEGKAVWEERTHYCSKDIANVVEETEVVISSDMAINPFVLAEIVDKKNYVVIWDGAPYLCTAYTVEGPGVPGLGNAEIVGAFGGNGEPFFITIFDGSVMVGATLDGKHTVSIGVEDVSIKTLDVKYMPEIVALTENDVTYTVICTPKGMPTTYADASMTVEGHLNVVSNYYDSMHVEAVASGEFIAGSRTYKANSINITDDVTYTMKSNASGEYLDIVFNYPLDVAYASPDSSNPSGTSLYLEGLRIWGHGSGNMVFDKKLSDYKSGDFSLTVTLQATTKGVKAHESITMWSATEGSTKRFKLTVDDSGALTATEVTD